jgi:molybdopterin-containing oxidoreductase family iron-sulfur binding subunit
MIIDLDRCQAGCTACMEACRTENNVAFHGDRRWDVHWIRKARLHPEDGTAGREEKEVLLMCNQCDDPPCAMVCPVQATYKREDGIVVVDQHRCIGCRYCMIACPYNCLLYTSPSPRDRQKSRMPSSA